MATLGFDIDQQSFHDGFQSASEVGGVSFFLGFIKFIVLSKLFIFLLFIFFSKYPHTEKFRDLSRSFWRAFEKLKI